MKKASVFSAILLILPSFSIYSQAPTVTSFSPMNGPVGTLITISGTGLSNPIAFTVGGATAIVVSNNGTTLVGLVMPGAVTGPVSVTTIGGTDTGSADFTVTPTLYPSEQLGTKLVGTGAVGAGWQGSSASISADGNTAIVGGYQDNGTTGAAWVYVLSGGMWIQQGNKLVGTGGGGWEGSSIALSADGNTAIVGGEADYGYEGAAWVYTRSGTSWTQQGNKLVGTGATGSTVGQGWSISLSADGNTAIIGGPYDNNDMGAAWIFTRSGGTWTQQGNKLVGTGAVGNAFQGSSVSISKDGNTAIVGGQDDNSYIGAAWVYTRSGATWTQQGNKLVGTGVSAGQQGVAASLSGDGNTAIVGAYGAVWIFTRSGGTWTQQGSDLIGTGATVNSVFGAAVSLSADGNIAIVGGEGDSSNIGAAWVFTRSGGTWTQQGGQLIGTGAVGAAYQGSSVSISADGNTAIVGGIGDNSTAGAAWTYNSVSLLPQGSLTGNGPFCNSGSGQLTWTATGGTGPYTLVYNDGTANRTVTNVVSGTAFNVFTEPVTANTTYTLLSVTGANSTIRNSGFTEDTATITVNNVNAGTITAHPDTICQGSTVLLLVNGNTGPVQWQSSNTTADFTNVAGVTGVSDSPVIDQSTYFRTYSSNGICADTSGSVLVFVNPLPATPSLSTTDSLICASDSTKIQAPGGYAAYLWNNGDTTNYTFVNSAGGYWLTVTDANGCSALSNHQSISVYPIPSVSIVVQGDTLSSFGSVYYQWYLNDTPVVNATGPVFVEKKPGSYTVAVTDSNGCTATSSPFVVATGINELVENEQVLLYPNPSVGNWQLTVDNNLVGSEVEIYDDNGRLVFQSLIHNPQSQINLNLAKGVYWLRISSANASIVRKLVKI